MTSRLTIVALALAMSLVLPPSAAVAQSADVDVDRPTGDTEGERLTVLGARIDPRDAGGFLDDMATGSIGNRGVNAPAAGYGIPAY